ncbi:Hypothetical predicted protein [Olea europaea subsp. europaea]|uniref:Uncharacterized protein n=1 Tax=Olea europaea subsp. europaea TaxID=158383 RepID=A0A8S0Q4J6_OLEEU|nr:Hypothetical predicted protein [Olea europaea subsp. europaea]
MAHRQLSLHYRETTTTASSSHCAEVASLFPIDDVIIATMSYPSLYLFFTRSNLSFPRFLQQPRVPQQQHRATVHNSIALPFTIVPSGFKGVAVRDTDFTATVPDGAPFQRDTIAARQHSVILKMEVMLSDPTTLI